MSDAPQESSQRTEEFLALLSEHDRSIYAFILAQVPDWQDAQEIAQETRLRLWKQYDRYEPGTDFGAWARTIAHFLVLAHRKKSKKRHAQLETDFLDAVADEVVQTSEELNSRQQFLQSCLEQLTDSTRRLVQMCYQGDASARQVADETGQPLETIRKRLYRARLALADCIDEKAKQEGER